ncbi:MAG: hypothetical protein GY787_30285 [Alteromonadales bacterium]|nr:hypothetical protein [Alteromonadales bacterium]
MTKVKPQVSIRDKLKRRKAQYKASGTADAFFGGDDTAKILSVTPLAIEYTDNNGKIHSIDFNECLENSQLGDNYIAGRNFCSASAPLVVFFDKKSTKFEFKFTRDAFKFAHETLPSVNLKTGDFD